MLNGIVNIRPQMSLDCINAGQYPFNDLDDGISFSAGSFHLYFESIAELP